ncbi:5-oxoprolinase subunit B family protein [Pukyongiella litopenaei]|uniref:Allophanate hydrolase subunit 1 n=1 Tax=Pukyongiella litopenaei TaxID=2605946 RepID=A0A2S0MMI1_9RHOB|nr:carboxyltransferase domain-containing protein [Pukyongiella litopenaei]AVO37092.1 allophanate hydrolase subunit 1 [Pukyongiella litopenaei]
MQNRTTKAPELLPLGRDGIVLRLALRPDPGATAGVQALRAALEAADLPGVNEIAPALASVLVRFDPARTTRDDLATGLRALVAGRDWCAADMPPPARRWTIPAAFGGSAGPQLSETAGLAGLDETRAVAELTATPLRVLAIGFAPGQPYLGLLPEHWDFPRQPELTPTVPAGALCAAVRQIVLFANPSTTGWRQVGLTGFRPFKADRAQPFALRPGDELRLSAVPDGEMQDLARNDPDGLGGARCEVLA